MSLRKSSEGSAIPVWSSRKSFEGYAVPVLSPRRRFRYCPSEKARVARVARVVRVVDLVARVGSCVFAFALSVPVLNQV